jgi:hypothetical protein
MYYPDNTGTTTTASRSFISKLCQVSSWLNDYIKQSAVIVKENETSDNSTLERRFRKGILSAISDINFTQMMSSDGGSGNLEAQAYKVTVNWNTNIEGFDVDIVVVFSKEGERDFVYNLEIDGPHHKKPHKENFIRLRDQLLLQKGLVHSVRRVSLFEGGDPRRTKVINRSTRDAIIQKEVRHMVKTVCVARADSLK